MPYNTEIVSNKSFAWIAIPIAAIAAFLIGLFVGCGAQRKGGETIKVDTVYKESVVVKNSVPQVIDSISYSRDRQNDNQTRRASRMPAGIVRHEKPVSTDLVQPDNPETPREGGHDEAPQSYALISIDTFRAENLTVATLDTISNNRIIGRKWWSDYRQVTIKETKTVEKKLPLLSLYGGAHATNMTTGTFYGPDAALSIRNNAFIYCNYTFVQNSSQFGVLLKLTK